MKLVLVLAALAALSACGSQTSGTAAGTGVISLKGGDGTTGAGGKGGTITTFRNSTSMVHGDLKFHTTGTVDVSFALPTTTLDFGSSPATITTDVTVETTKPATSGYFVSSSDNNLHFTPDGTGDSPVTGLNVKAGGILRLPTTTNPITIPNAVIIDAGGRVTTTPTATSLANSVQLQLSSGGILINQGTVDSNGVNGGSSGGVTLNAATFLYNTGNVTATGDGVGTGGAIVLQADEGSFFTNGKIDASGSTGGTITISAGSTGVGRVVVGGTLTGNGSSGNGSAITLSSASGGVLVNGTISATGGASATGGDGGTLQLINSVSSDIANGHEVSPEGVKVAGNITLTGGPGTGQGGKGGTISVVSDIAGSSLPGFASVEFFGYQSISINGGASTSGNGGDGGAIFGAVSAPAPIIGIDIPAGGVFNEVPISAKGGDNSPNSPTKTAAGGAGGSVTLTTPQVATETSDPARSLVTNSGGIDVSGGTGTTGGTGGSVSMKGYGNVTNSGAITAVGGTGTTGPGGAGSTSISLSSSSNVVNSGGINASGGTTTSGTGGAGGSVSVSSGNHTSTAGITATGGNSTSGNGGSGGTIVLLSEFTATSRSSLTVAKGSGGSAQNGTIKIDGSFANIPPSGTI